MESIAILVVVVIAYNVIRLLARAAGGGRSGRPQNAPPGSFDSEPGPVTGPVALPASPGKRSLRDSLFDFDAYEEHPRLTPPDFSPFAGTVSKSGFREEPPAREGFPLEAFPVRERTVSAKPAPVAGKGLLANVFNGERSLVAAFIFHEILEPPPSLRRDSGPGEGV